MEKSIWQKYNKRKEYDSLKEDISTDILIIGAGLTGVTLAYNLIDKKYDVTLIDRDKCFNDTISKSTGKITYLQDLKYQDIINIYDFDTAKTYYESQKEAIRIIKKNIKDNNINCDLAKNMGITYTCDLNEVNKFKKEEWFFDKLGVNYINDTSILKNKDVKSLIAVKNTYVFNPVKYLNGLLKKIDKSSNIKIYENSTATKILDDDNSYVVSVNNNNIKAKKIVIACNFPFFTIPGFIPFKTYLEKSYLSCGRVDKVKKVNAITSNYPTVSYRYYNDYFIYLSNSSKISNRLNYNKNYKTNIKGYNNITGNSPLYKWFNTDVMTNDYMPLIGNISIYNNNAFIATGYNTWGITNGTIAAKIIYDLLLGKKNKYTNIFNPKRKMNYKIIKNFISNTVSVNSKAYITGLIKKNPTWYKDKAVIKNINGKRVGIYYDEKGIRHMVSNICPHMKCFLTFNTIDKTWDCPCHASRFDIDGNVIKGPSVYSIKIDETNT